MNTERNSKTIGWSERVKPVTQHHILDLLNDLPPESLVVVEQFIQFLHQQAQQGQPVVTVFDKPTPYYRYQTVLLPASTLDGWLKLLSEGYEGDALADTEALYDEI